MTRSAVLQAWSPMKPATSDPALRVGDGVLLYAGDDGPLATIRLHNIRDGVEDFGYLALLRQLRGDAAVQAAIAPLSNRSDQERHIGGSRAELDAFMAQRLAVARMIEAAMWPAV